MSKDYQKVAHFVFICNGSSCKDDGAKPVEKELYKQLKDKGHKGHTKIIKTKCHGLCKEAPVMVIKDQWHTKVKASQVPKIVEKHLTHHK